MVKIFGVGNILLCDDGIGVKVAEALKNDLEKIDTNIEVIIGETDAYYCSEKLNDDDFVIIIDSTYFMKKPGTVIYKSFSSCDEFIEEIYTVHDVSLLKVLRAERRNIKGYLVGIEVEKVEYSLNLSRTLQKNFTDICKRVYENIIFILKGEKII